MSEEQQQDNGTGAAFQELGESLQETFQLLGTTLDYLFQTLQSLLRSVGLLLQGILSALADGLGSSGASDEEE